ncbi:MAG TPA: UPF0182 family protein [Blastocatellia bacterium]|nr:UPF0182 family protein [Blastocatellia bacterium]
MREEQDFVFDDFETDPSGKGDLRRRKIAPGNFGRQPLRWRLWLVLALLLFVLIGWPMWAGFYTDWLWFNELGFQSIFSTVLTTKLITGLVGGIVAALLSWLSLQAALRISGQNGQAGYRFYVANQEIALADAGHLIAKLTLPLSLLVGVFFGLRSWGEWDEFLLFRHGVPFGQADPVLGFDIGFYFFKLPFFNFLSGALLALLGLALLATIVVYLGRAAISIQMSEGEKPTITMQSGARTHLLVLIAALLVVLAWRYYLDLPAMLFGASGTVSGAGYTDVNANIPLLWAKIAVLLLIALAAVACIFLRSLRLLTVGVALFALVTIASFLYPLLIQRFSVAPNELQKEAPYIAHSIAATRKAYNLDTVEERDLTGETMLTAKDIQENKSTINGIRLWDQGPLLATFTQLQSIRSYYGFKGMDNDRYKINGEMQQLMLSVRELDSDKLQNRNWINERLIFTHGYGLAVGPVHQVTPAGLPVLFVKDIPPVTSHPELKIDRPEIYYGEMTNEQVYVRTKQQEFNYPEGEKNQFTTYQGNGGVPLNSYLHKLMFATRFGDLKLMLSDDMTAESRVLFRRNIRERLSEIAPFLRIDYDPYIVITEGKCYWICDAYTTSYRYPYSQPIRVDGQTELNYIRNSVKAVVDAYNGNVQLYVSDAQDPVLQTYAKIFPGVFQPLTAMPANLRAHLRYPEDIFRIQTQVYTTYHMDQPQVFYNKEDQWEIASASERDGQPNLMEPYYTIMKLPDATAEEFLVMLPFVPKNKLNLAAWMVARCDGENYGKMVVYRFPKQKQIYGPKQIVGRINQVTEISSQLTLWDQRGSKVIFGTMLVIPIKESLLYVQPLYLQADTGKIPELKRVIVAYGEDRIAMGETLEQSLLKLFGDSAAAPPGETLAKTAPAQPGAPSTTAPTSATSSLAAQALQQYDRAEQALRAGDFAKYGEELKRLRATLEEMSRAK